MNRNNKIQNSFCIFEVSKSIQPSQCIQQMFLSKKFLYVFPIFFQSLMSLETLRCDVPCGTTQSYFHSKVTYLSTYLLMKNIKVQMLLYTLTIFYY
jgi:hypothetical protein